MKIIFGTDATVLLWDSNVTGDSFTPRPIHAYPGPWNRATPAERVEIAARARADYLASLQL